MKTTEKIRQQINDNPVILYMKGTPQFPQCGFSSKAATLLKSTDIPFSYVNVLESAQVMQALPEVSDFPTFPQLFIEGEIIGGSDIIEALLNNGELLPMLKNAVAPDSEKQD